MYDTSNDMNYNCFPFSEHVKFSALCFKCLTNLPESLSSSSSRSGINGGRFPPRLPETQSKLREAPF